MHKRLTLVLLIFLLAAVSAGAQPFDLIVPGTDSPDTLSRELRDLHAIERDLAIEKLTREPSKLEAYLELGELRLSQGKLLEAQRFYEMALQIDPKNRIANQGLVMVHYHKGEFDMARDMIEKIHPLETVSESLKYQITDYASPLKNQAQFGLSIREDDRGLSEIVTSVEGIFPSFTFRKLTGRYRYEGWMHKDNDQSVNSQVLSSTFDYRSDKNTILSIGYAPELFAGEDSIGGYHAQAITGTDNLHICLRTSRNTFKENLQTVQNQLSETASSISLYGNLHPRTRASQTITATDFSDGNSRRQYDAELMHFIYRQGAPFLSLNLKLSQMSYDKQFNEAGNILYYWAPSDFVGGELTLGWERSVGSRWWWGIDTFLSGNSYEFGGDDKIQDTGLGAMVHASYNFTSGRLYASLGDRINRYFRERKLEVYGSFQF
jgi:tetratricopeptide (TPR) repeat protein